MINSLRKKQPSSFYKILCGFITLTFLAGVILPPQVAWAQVGTGLKPVPTILNLPVPGTMVAPSTGFVPARLIGVTVHPDDPLKFDFIVNSGDVDLAPEALKEESRKLIKYFLASLTVPEDELWVNLSPYEKDRMIPQGLGATEMGRDMLAQDYLLKQLTASLMYPEKELGKKFWEKIYKKAREQYGIAEVPVNTFNKVWVVPREAVVYEKDTSAYVVKSRLKVMLESDYQAMSHQDTKSQGHQENASGDVVTGDVVTTGIIREVIIPAIEQEINEGENFANLRQMYNSLILAAWYKLKLKDGLLAKVYVDQNKTKGIDTEDKQINQKIYDQYIESFKKGVYNYIKEDTDPTTQDVIPRKYFSGGLGFAKGIVTMVAASLMTWGTSPQPAQAADVINAIKNGKNKRIEVVLGENPKGPQIIAALEPPVTTSSSPVDGNEVNQPMESMEDYERIIRNYALHPDPYAKIGPVPAMVQRGVTFEEAKVWYAVKREFKPRFPNGFWQHSNTAKNMLLVALDTAMPGFKEFWDHGKIREMAELYRKNVIVYPGGQTAFFQKAGLASLINWGSLIKMNSPGSVLRLHLPGLINDNNPDALKSFEVEKKASAFSSVAKVGRKMLDILTNPDLYGVTFEKGADIALADQSILVWIGEPESPESEQAQEIVNSFLAQKPGNFTVTHRGGPIFLRVTLFAAADPRAELREWMEEMVAFEEMWNPGASASSPVGNSRQLKTDDGRLTSNPGGIDLNPALLDLQIKRDGNGVPLPLPQQPIGTMRIDGFVPIIINITPIPDLPMLLGLADTEPNKEAARPDLKSREVETVSSLN